MPASRAEFWDRKFRATSARDSRVQLELEADGWRVMVVWECETRRTGQLSERLVAFLGLHDGNLRQGRGDV